MEENFDWVTDEMFQEKMEDILAKMSVDDLLAIPGFYEIASEELNNQILEELELEREEDI